MNYPLNECVFVDIETTGLDPDLDAIIEIAALKVMDGKIVGWFSSLIHRDDKLPEIVSTLTGITAEDLMACPSSPEQVITHFRDFVGNLPLIGHNIIDFDSKFLGRNYNAIFGEPLHNDLIDTLPSSYYSDIFEEAINHKLTTLAAMVGEETENAHRALADCRLTFAIAKAMWEEGETEAIPCSADWYQELKKAG